MPEGTTNQDSGYQVVNNTFYDDPEGLFYNELKGLQTISPEQFVTRNTHVKEKELKPFMLSYDVSKGVRWMLERQGVEAEMIETSIFPDYGDKYKPTGEGIIKTRIRFKDKGGIGSIIWVVIDGIAVPMEPEAVPIDPNYKDIEYAVSGERYDMVKGLFEEIREKSPVDLKRLDVEIEVVKFGSEQGVRR